MTKAKRTYKCETCNETIAKKGEEIDDILDIWQGWNEYKKKTTIFCSTECAARWHCDETDLTEIQEQW